jgi:hypothetical protein
MKTIETLKEIQDPARSIRTSILTHTCHESIPLLLQSQTCHEQIQLSRARARNNIRMHACMSDLCMCICVCGCKYVRTYVHMYVWMHIFLYVWMRAIPHQQLCHESILLLLQSQTCHEQIQQGRARARNNIHMHVCMSWWTYECRYVRMNVRMNVRMDVRMCVNASMHECTYECTYKCTYVRINVRLLARLYVEEGRPYPCAEAQPWLLGLDCLSFLPLLHSHAHRRAMAMCLPASQLLIRQGASVSCSSSSFQPRSCASSRSRRGSRPELSSRFSSFPSLSLLSARSTTPLGSGLGASRKWSSICVLDGQICCPNASDSCSYLPWGMKILFYMHLSDCTCIHWHIHTHRYTCTHPYMWFIHTCVHT